LENPTLALPDFGEGTRGNPISARGQEGIRFWGEDKRESDFGKGIRGNPISARGQEGIRFWGEDKRESDFGEGTRGNPILGRGQEEKNSSSPSPQAG